MGIIKITGRDAPLTDEGLAEMMKFMDEFVDSELAAKGFAITYDLRNLHIPSMSMIRQVAEWGGEPTRKEKWESRNLVCKVVMSSGIRFSLCKGLISAFFLLCPPVCRTFLLTDPDQSDEDATIFEPAVNPAKLTKNGRSCVEEAAGVEVIEAMEDR